VTKVDLGILGRVEFCDVTSIWVQFNYVVVDYIILSRV